MPKTKKTDGKSVTIWLHGDVDRELLSRGNNRSQVVNRDLGRLYATYKRALREIPLTTNEAWFLTDMLNGIALDADTACILWASVEDACLSVRMDEKWSVDGPALVEKIRKLDSVQALALIDAAERWWESEEAIRGEDLLREIFCLR